MTIASLADVKANLNAYVKAIKKSPVVITRKGKAIAVIVPVLTPGDVERICMAYNPKLRAILAKSKAQIRAGLGIPHDEFWRQVEARYPKRPQKKSA